MIVVLVSTYNRPERLKEFLKMLRSQTSKKWVCMVLDESPEKYAHEHDKGKDICVVECEDKNDWGYSAKEKIGRNVPDDAWLWFPNDDHVFKKEFLEKMTQCATDEASDLVLCDFKHQGNSKSAAPTVGSVDIGTFIVRASVFKKYGFFNKDACGDGHLVQKMFRDKAKTSIVREELVEVS